MRLKRVLRYHQKRSNYLELVIYITSDLLYAGQYLLHPNRYGGGNIY